MQVTLPGDEWVEIKEVDELRDGDRKAVNKAVKVEIDPDAERPIMPGDFNDVKMDALLCRIIKNWSFRLPLPSEYPPSLDALTLGQAKALHAAVRPHFSLINGEEDPTQDSAS